MHKVYHTLVTVTKMCGLNNKKMATMATTIERVQPNFTPLAPKSTNPENWAKIGRAVSEIIGFERVVKPEAV